MEKSVITHLIKTEKKLKCKCNTDDPEYDHTVYYMIKNKTVKGNVRCPCSVDGKTFCPCKEWVQKVKSGVAVEGDMCHCEVFVKAV